MKLGLITDSLGDRPLEDALDFIAQAGLESVELAAGGWSESPHLDVTALLGSASARRKLSDGMTSRGLELTALNANGNQLHPVTGEAEQKRILDMVTLAGEMGVPTVALMSGLPGARGESTPNWITTSWPPETLSVLKYQWEEVAIPYWEKLAAHARANGVRLAVEMHGRQLVFNPATMRRLRDGVGDDVIGANLDPSHLMWMGADIPTVIRELGDMIYHVHAKDARIEQRNLAINGVHDTLPPSEFAHRSWNYITLGLGHPGGADFWAEVIYTLRSVGYDGPLNIEHEDVLVGTEEGIRRSADLLHRVVLRDPPDWTPADI